MKVVGTNQILISHSEMIKTVDNIKANPAICLTTFDQDWKGVRMYGQAQYHTTGKWHQMAKKLFTTDKSTPKGAIIVTVDSLEEQS